VSGIAIGAHLLTPSRKKHRVAGMAVYRGDRGAVAESKPDGAKGFSASMP